MRRITLGDVATDAGVSKATVSAVINNNPLVAEATRERVLASIERTSYVYDWAAASLRKKQTKAVGLIVTTLTNPYFAEFAEGIQGELDERGMDVLLGVSADEPERERRLLRSMDERRVDGIVMVPANRTEASTLAAVTTPLLLLARRIKGIDLDYVGGANTEGCRTAADHLITRHGCRRLAFIGGLDMSSSRVERLTGFLEGAAAHGLDIPEERQPTCPSNRGVARQRAVELFRQHNVDGVVCYNDIIAFGVLDAAADLGLRVGHDVRIIGFDDVEDAAFARPPLSSLAVSAHLAGQRAAEMLLARVTGSRTEVEEAILPAEFKPRASCGC